MKAIQYTAYGDSSVIHMNQVDTPVPGENEVLIKIAALSVNPMDMKIRSGALQQRMPVQLPYIPGIDAAGTVEAVGSGVSRLRVGDKVFATTFGGTYAEYVVINEGQVSLIPDNVTMLEAASLAVPIATAYTFLIEKGEVAAGQRVLIQGAAGGTGSIMVQMAKALGAYVIGTASGDGVAFGRSLGADDMIDYKTQDFTKLAEDIDVVIDLVGGPTQTKSFEVLKEGGKLLSAVMPPDEEMAKAHNVTAGFFSSTPSHKKLDYGRKLVEAGKIKPNVSEIMKLSEAAQAQDRVSAGGVDGKIVLETA